MGKNSSIWTNLMFDMSGLWGLVRPKRMRWAPLVSQSARVCWTYLMKYSGVLPVGREQTAFGLFCINSIKRIAVNIPNSGNELTITESNISVSEYRRLSKFDNFMYLDSTTDIQNYGLEECETKILCGVIIS